MKVTIRHHCWSSGLLWFKREVLRKVLWQTHKYHTGRNRKRFWVVAIAKMMLLLWKKKFGFGVKKKFFPAASDWVEFSLWKDMGGYWLGYTIYGVCKQMCRYIHIITQVTTANSFIAGTCTHAVFLYLIK